MGPSGFERSHNGFSVNARKCAFQHIREVKVKPKPVQVNNSESNCCSTTFFFVLVNVKINTLQKDA